VRFASLVLALLIGFPALAQEQETKKPAPAAKKAPHGKATPEQIRRFNELAKKRQATKSK
jgi:hypothetical protein